jgi:hypothetical protein
LNVGVGRASARRGEVLAKTGAAGIRHRILQNIVGTVADPTETRRS